MRPRSPEGRRRGEGSREDQGRPVPDRPVPAAGRARGQGQCRAGGGGRCHRRHGLCSSRPSSPTSTCGLGIDVYNAKKYDRAGSLRQGAGDRSAQRRCAQDDRRSACRAGPQGRSGADFQRAIQARPPPARSPRRICYKRALGVAYEASLPVSVDLGRQWAAAYPNADSWHNSVAIYRNMTKPDVEGTLDLLPADARDQCADRHRLQLSCDRGDRPVELHRGPGGARRRAWRQSRSTRPSPLVKEAWPRLKTKPRPTEADLAAAIKTAQTPTALIRIGDRYYGLGEYAKAADVYRAALAKPGADADDRQSAPRDGARARGRQSRGDRRVQRGDGTARGNREILAAVPAVARLTPSVEERGGASAHAGALSLCGRVRSRNCPVSGWLRAAVLARPTRPHRAGVQCVLKEADNRCGSTIAC